MTHPATAPLLLVLLAPAALATGGLPGSRLHEGGFGARRLEQRPDDPAARELLEAAYALRLRLALDEIPEPGSLRPRALPKALGDRLVMSLDDDLMPVGAAWEGRLDVSGGLAGPDDAVAIRFSAQSLAVGPPFDVRSVILGVDDRHGIRDWPVQLWLEDGASPLQPRRGAVTASGTATPGLAAVSGPRPTAFERVPVALSLRVPDAWLSDGAFDDAFERTDGPLSDTNPDWFECEDGACGRLPLDVDVVSGSAVRRVGGGSLIVVKSPAPAQDAMRPHDDLDLRASVRVVDSAATFSRAGLILRAIAADAHYRVEYRKSPSQVEVSVVLPPPFGVLPVGAPLAVATPSTGSRLLEVVVTGGTSAVRFDVTVDGANVGFVSDPTWRLDGWYAGLSASDPASSGEAWDDLRIERRPDVFVVVGMPPGEDAGLPVDRSDASRISRSILLSDDGTTFGPLAAAPGCPNPGNPFVQLEVEDSVAGDRLFQREAHVVAVGIACPTCPTGTATCTSNLSALEREPPTLTAGEPATARVRWWNEHLADDTLIFRASLWSGPCTSAGGLMLATDAVSGVASGGQGPAGASEVDVFTFMPTDPGPHCLVVEELHDSNGDCCPDGAESTPMGGCGGACVAVPPSDSNPASLATFVDLNVAGTCDLRKGEDIGRDGPDDLDGDRLPDEINLDGGSLRVAREAGEAVALTWAVNDVLVFPATYNVLLARAATFEPSACYPAQAPVAAVVVGATGILLNVPVLPGETAWLAVFETDGCEGRASVPDSSLDDAGLRCP